MSNHQYVPGTLTAEWYNDCDGGEYYVFKYQEKSGRWMYTGAGFTKEETIKLAMEWFGESNLRFTSEAPITQDSSGASCSEDFGDMLDLQAVQGAEDPMFLDKE